MEERKPARMTDDGALVCRADQLPPDRCVACYAPAKGTPGALTMCASCSPRVALPAVLTIVVLASTIANAMVNGLAWLQLIGGLGFATILSVVTWTRWTRRAAQLPAGAQIEIRDFAPEIRRDVLALGAAPHRAELT